MTHRPYWTVLPALAACALLAGCSARTDVSLTGNTPAQYSHVFITVAEVWFNSDANAGPDDGGWAKFPLSTPSTVDLVAQNGGNLSSIASGLRITPGSYGQLRLIPVDSSAALAPSAQNAGALYNFEADFVDSNNALQQLPLELLNPDKGIGIQTSLSVPIGGLRGALGALGTGTGTGASTTMNGTTNANPFGTSSTGTTSSPTPLLGSSSNNTTPNNSFAAALDGSSALLPFTYASGTTGILWSAHAAAYDLSTAGGISGQLSLSNLRNGASGLQVSAESLSTDGSRHDIVAATTVASDGSFLLYPLATNSSTSSPLTYDVVIHGPGIATIIVKSVQVPRAASSSTVTATSTSASNSANSSSSSSSASTTSSTTNNANVNAVSIGTLTPRTVLSYSANIATAPGAALPPGAVVNFYQSLGSQGDVPYVIESSPIDPFNQVLFSAQALSRSTIDSGTWSTNGTVTIVSSAPANGAGIYLVAASAPGFRDGALQGSVSVSPPNSGTATVVVPALSMESGATAGSLSVNVVATPGKYDQGELLVSHDGALVASAPLGAVLTQGAGGTVKVANVPSGVPEAVYYLTVRAWNSTAPGSVQRQWYPQMLDLRTSTSAATAVTVN